MNRRFMPLPVRSESIGREPACSSSLSIVNSQLGAPRVRSLLSIAVVVVEVFVVVVPIVVFVVLVPIVIVFVEVFFFLVVVFVGVVRPTFGLCGVLEIELMPRVEVDLLGVAVLI